MAKLTSISLASKTQLSLRNVPPFPLIVQIELVTTSPMVMSGLLPPMILALECRWEAPTGGGGTRTAEPKIHPGTFRMHVELQRGAARKTIGRSLAEPRGFETSGCCNWCRPPVLHASMKQRFCTVRPPVVHVALPLHVWYSIQFAITCRWFQIHDMHEESAFTASLNSLERDIAAHFACHQIQLSGATKQLGLPEVIAKPVQLRQDARPTLALGNRFGKWVRISLSAPGRWSIQKRTVDALTIASVD